MKKTLLFTLGLLAASTTAWADVVDFLSTSGFKAYKIQARRGPNAAGTAYDDNSGKGFMLTNKNSESDLKAYANWYQGTTFFNETYSATNHHHNFLLIKADYGTFIYSLGKNAYLATGEDHSVSFATTPTTATINTSGNDATYKYYITTSNNRQVNFNDYGGSTGVSGFGTSKDNGSLFTFVENTQTVDEATINTIKEAIKTYTKEYYLSDVEGIKSHLGEVGYPTQAAYDALENALNTATTKDAAATALQNFYNSVKYPEDGKAYYIEGVNRGGTRTGYVYFNSTQLKFATELATPMPDEAIYYCHKLGDRKYMFTTKDGKYLMYATDSNGERKGMEDAYDANKNTLTLQPMSYDATRNYYDCNNDILTVNKNTVGLFLIRGKRAYNTKEANHDYYLMAGFHSGNFHASYSTTVFYTTNEQTSAFKFVEVPQPQNNAIKTTAVKLSDATDAETYNLATYSSPFATTLPSDMKAYTVKNENGNYYLSRLNLTDQVLPANTGVILASNEANTFIPVPATTAPEAPTNNQLQATSGAAVTVDAATNAYIFTAKDKVAFFGLLSSSMRRIKAFKAYLTVESNAAPRLSLNFGDDNVTTGINTITNGEQKADIIYDLSGRRVMNVQRAGVYIVNGQKRLIK
uniref:hypothetical protein n=1 Tax=Alloprevotella sp. TaxID=1872471 RepID=UPI003FEE70D0